METIDKIEKLIEKADNADIFEYVIAGSDEEVDICKAFYFDTLYTLTLKPDAKNKELAKIADIVRAGKKQAVKLAETMDGLDVETASKEYFHIKAVAWDKVVKAVKEMRVNKND